MKQKISDYLEGKGLAHFLQIKFVLLGLVQHTACDILVFFFFFKSVLLIFVKLELLSVGHNSLVSLKKEPWMSLGLRGETYLQN